MSMQQGEALVPFARQATPGLIFCPFGRTSYPGTAGTHPTEKKKRQDKNNFGHMSFTIVYE